MGAKRRTGQWRSGLETSHCDGAMELSARVRGKQRPLRYFTDRHLRGRDMIPGTRVGRRGVTIIEFLSASSVTTVVGGAMLLLITGMRQVYETHTAFQQLSGYLDVASSTLRNDIWGATASFQGANFPAAN